MRIIIFSQELKKVSGLSTFERIFCKKMSKYFEILYLYKEADPEAVAELSKYVKVQKDDESYFYCDICIYSSIVHGMPESRIIAKKYAQIYHADLKVWDVKFNPPEKITMHIAVGKDVAKTLKEHYSIDAVVIPNMLDEPKLDKVLRLMTASRIQEGKGFERMVKLAKMLKSAGKKFIWEIYGDGSFSYLNDIKYQLSGVPEVLWMGAKTEIQSYMACSDYVVQLSDHEGFCYSIHEALQIHKPVLVTDWPYVRDVVVPGENGYIFDMELSSVDISQLFNNIPESSRLIESESEQKWLELLK